MKTMIWNGGTRKGGDTDAMVDQMAASLCGEVWVVDAFRAGISPCIDCRHCWKQTGCAVPDAMQEVYEKLTHCDNLVLASPVWYAQVSGPMMNIASRLQCYYAARRFRGEQFPFHPKQGVILLCGGGDEGSEQRALKTARIILRAANAQPVAEVCTMQTNTIPAAKDPRAMREIREAACLLSEKRA